MHIRGNDPRLDPDKSVIPREKLNDEELDRIVAETTAQLLKTEHHLSNIQAAQSDETSKASNKHGHHPHSLAQPKRPMNAFMVWGQCIRRQLHNRYTNVQNAMLSKALGRVWKRLNLDEKKPYVERAGIIKANHKRDYPNYRYQPRRIQERRARMLKEAAAASNEYTSLTSETAIQSNTQYQQRDFVASYSGTHADSCPNHTIASTSQRPYVIHEPYLTSAGNNESVLMGQHQQHEIPYNDSQAQQPAMVYYDQVREVSTIVHGQDVIEEQQQNQYVAYSHQTIMVEGQNNFIYAQSDKYSSLAETSSRNKASLQNQQPHQYYPPVHSDTVYYLAPRVREAEGPFPIEY